MLPWRIRNTPTQGLTTVLERSGGEYRMVGEGVKGGVGGRGSGVDQDSDLYMFVSYRFGRGLARVCL